MKTNISWSNHMLDTCTDEVITIDDVYDGFMEWCEDSDNLDEVTETTSEYNAETGNNITIFDMWLIWQISSDDLREVK